MTKSKYYAFAPEGTVLYPWRIPARFFLWLFHSSAKEMVYQSGRRAHLASPLLLSWTAPGTVAKGINWKQCQAAAWNSGIQPASWDGSGTPALGRTIQWFNDNTAWHLWSSSSMSAPPESLRMKLFWCTSICSWQPLCTTECTAQADVKGLCLDLHCILLLLRNQCKIFWYCSSKFPRTTQLLNDDNVFKVLGSAWSARKISEKGGCILGFLGQFRLDFIKREERYFYEEQVSIIR